MPIANQKRFFAFMLVALIFIFVIIGVAVNAATPKKPHTTPTPTPGPATPTPTLGPPPTISFTVTSQVGLSSIIYHNQNNGATKTLVTADLPWSVNVKYGDTITLKAIPISGYRANGWTFGDKTVLSSDSNGYLTWKVTYPFSIEADFLMESSG